MLVARVPCLAALLSVLKESWYEIYPGYAVREQALRALRLHPLRAADALQLTAALEWAGSPPDCAFVSFDEPYRLRHTAKASVSRNGPSLRFSHTLNPSFFATLRCRSTRVRKVSSRASGDK